MRGCRAGWCCMCIRSMPSPGPCNPARRPRWPRRWTASAGVGSTTTGPDCRSRARWRGLGGGWADTPGPGLPLARAGAQRLAQPPMDASLAQPPEDGLPVPPPVDAPPSIDVLLLGNHGLVVGGASVLHAEQRLAEVAGRLRRPVRAAPAADGAGLALDAAATGWRLPGNARGHAVATDPVNLERAVRGVLYPDHVVFLGHQMSVVPAALARGGPALSAWLRAHRRSAGPAPLIAVPGRGVLLRDDLSEAACEMLTCLADVLQRLPPSGAPVYLPDEEAQALAHWEAEQFRQAQVR